MTRTHISPGHQPAQARALTAATTTETDARNRRLTPFWRHFLQMLAAMMVGMIVTGAIFLSVVGAKTWDEVTTGYPTQALLAMAAGMTIPMVWWMTYRGMRWRDTMEMAAAMVLPVVPFLFLVWFDVTDSAQCGPYCVATIAAMLGLMFYRREHYSASTDRSPSTQSR